MKKDVFRSIDFWKTAVMTMPDNSFFELVRSVFGKIKTPFNKQQLANELETFLQRDDIQLTIAGYIDENDAKVIAAVALFGEPSFADLESFFSDEMSGAELQDITVNLEERFILYRFKEDPAKAKGASALRFMPMQPLGTPPKPLAARLALNPVLEKILLPFAENVSALFPAVDRGKVAKTESKNDAENKDVKGNAEGSQTAEPQAAQQTLIDDRILAGLFSFISSEEPFYRAEGVIRKKVMEAAKACFPGLQLELVLSAMQALSLLYVNEEKLLADRKRRDDFGTLSLRERMEYMAAAFIACKGAEASNGYPFLRSRIGELASFIHCFMESIDADKLYPEKTLLRLVKIIEADTNIDAARGLLFEALELTGLLQAAHSNVWRLGINALKKDDAKHEGPLITIDSGSSVFIHPEISYDDAVSLAQVLSVKEAGPLVRFEMDKEQAVRAFDRNVNAEEIIGLLQRLSDGKVSDSLAFTLKDWEKRHGEVSLRKGVILGLTEEKRYLTETRFLSELICETLAPGLYLLPEDAMDKAATVLKSAGVDIVARPESKPKARGFDSHYFPPPARREPYNELISSKGGGLPENHVSDLTANFHAMLEKSSLSKTAKTELAARIDRKLVLSEAQLTEADIRYEKLEARHMDYAGKQNIARQAVSQQAPVEVVWGGGAKKNRCFGVPRALEKEGAELILVFASAPGEEATRVPLGKMSLIRRIKKSIFEIT
ncbi:MAG: helicase-associated domain-containing protein [Treponema sp.]|jgi:hypothetical protein|nr:helicase-associated domain-containing protein [Treponema sp.]